MKTRSMILVSLLACFTVGNAVAQTFNHPWHVNDNGGGSATSGGMRLTYSIGQPAIQGGASAGMTLEGGYIPGFRFYSGTGEFELQMEAQWNLLSVPCIVGDFRKTTIYPAATSAAFVYSGGYQPEDTLRVGIGFWLKFDSSVSVPLTGLVVAEETVDVLDKWNIIGSLSQPTPVVNIAAIPPASIVSNYFGYSGVGGYLAADTLQPGYGYWVKVNGAGKVVLTTTASIPPSVAAAKSASNTPAVRLGQEHHSITVVDALGRERTVWFVSSADTGDAGKRQLPPPPPAGIMDVRFATDLLLETAVPGKTRDVTLRITAVEYPVTIRWNVHGTDENTAILLLGERGISLEGSGATTIDSPPSDIRLRLAPAIADPVPGEFSLGQNYPNPFNPSTRIPYQLAAGGNVSIVVFNVLGQSVSTLVGEFQEAGYRTVEWNAANVPGGVYFCRMRAPGFEATRKILVLK